MQHRVAHRTQRNPIYTTRVSLGLVARSDSRCRSGPYHQELLRVMREVGGLTEAEAAARLEAMAAEGKYQRDVWFG